MTSLTRLLTAALAVALLVPAAAHASSSMETGIADDAALLNEPNDLRAAATVASWAALGIDDVRIFVQWQAIAPANGDTKAPAGFNSADPNSPGYNWSRVDRAVNLVSAAGMRPLLVVTGSDADQHGRRIAQVAHRIRGDRAEYAIDFRGMEGT